MLPNLAECVKHVVVGFADADNHTKHVHATTLRSLSWGWIVILERSTIINVGGNIGGSIVAVMLVFIIWE